MFGASVTSWCDAKGRQRDSSWLQEVDEALLARESPRAPPAHSQHLCLSGLWSRTGRWNLDKSRSQSWDKSPFTCTCAETLQSGALTHCRPLLRLLMVHIYQHIEWDSSVSQETTEWSLHPQDRNVQVMQRPRQNHPASLQTLHGRRLPFLTNWFSHSGSGCLNPMQSCTQSVQWRSTGHFEILR